MSFPSRQRGERLPAARAYGVEESARGGPIIPAPVPKKRLTAAQLVAALRRELESLKVDNDQHATAIINVERLAQELATAIDHLENRFNEQQATIADLVRDANTFGDAITALETGFRDLRSEMARSP